MKECPRCKKATLQDDNVLNSISHEDRNVYICSKCGDMESLVKLGASVPKDEILMTEEFQSWLKSRKKK